MKASLVARRLRRGWRRFRAQIRYPTVDMGAMPVLFANSFPKSGTHLLTQILAGFSRLGPVAVSGLPPVLTFRGASGQPRPREAIRADLGRLLPGDIAYGHLHAFPEVLELLCAEGYAPFFIYRDPRDVVVSHVFYVTDINNRHVHHDYYVNELSDFGQRLRVSILGRPELQIPFPDIAARFEPYLPWLERPEVLALRYEELLEDQAAALGRIFDHARARGFVYAGSREAALRTLAAAIDPQSSPTYRRGRRGGWRQHFSAEHKTLFKAATGDLLQRLGYEKDRNW